MSKAIKHSNKTYVDNYDSVFKNRKEKSREQQEELLKGLLASESKMITHDMVRISKDIKTSPGRFSGETIIHVQPEGYVKSKGFWQTVSETIGKWYNRR